MVTHFCVAFHRMFRTPPFYLPNLPKSPELVSLLQQLILRHKRIFSPLSLLFYTENERWEENKQIADYMTATAETRMTCF